MMRRVRIVPVEDEHVEHVADHMRDVDVQEIWAASHMLPFPALEASVGKSDKAWTGLVDGEPAAIFGIGTVSVLSGVGIPWMLGTDRLVECASEVARVSRQAVPELQSRYPVLRNVIDARSTVSIRWLRWLGFTFSGPFEFGPDHMPFLLFEMRAQACAD